MTCRKLLSEISNYLDEDVDPAVRQELEEHMAKCPDCWVVIDTTRKTIQIYRGCCEPYPIPQNLHDRLQKALRKHYRQATGRSSS